MNRIYLLLMAFCIGALSANAQTYPLVTIRQIQEVPVDSLGTTITGDLSPYVGDTVVTRGVVVTQPGVGVSSSTMGRWIWIQDGNGPWSGINVRKNGGAQTVPDDMLNVVPGDSIQLIGVVEEFLNETQLVPLDSGFSILTGVSGLRPVKIKTLTDLSAFQLTNPPIPSNLDGEPIEATFVEIIGVEVVNVLSTSSDIRFTVKDANNNEIEVYDTYTVQQPSTIIGNNQIPFPPFSPPAIGDIFDTLRGIVDGRNFGASPPYAIAPFDTTHYVYGPSAPKISNVFRNIQVPTDAQQVTITATISDNGGSIVGAPQLFYAFGEATLTYTPIAMTFTGGSNQYTAVIPAAADGQMVKYYIQATDNDGITTSVPNATPSGKKFFYFIRNTGTLTIRDIQYTPYSDGQSGYLGETVTVQGVVSASIADNDFNDFVYIQDVGTSEWGGIRLSGGITVNNFLSTPRGELVTVNGVVQEDFGFTQIEIIDNNGFQVVATVGAPAPINVNPGDFSSYDPNFEKYEGLLIRMSPATPSDSIYVIEDNADGASDFGEFRVGRDIFNPTNGCRVLVGRGSGSYNVSYTTPNVFLDPGYSASQIIVGQGDRMNGVSGVLYYSFGNFKLLPRNNSDFENYEGGTPVSLINRNNVLDNSLQIYPNPTRSELNFIQAFEDKTYDLSIYNLMGQEVWNAKSNGKVNTFDLNKLVDGQYILRVTEKGNFVESFQLIINQ